MKQFLLIIFFLFISFFSAKATEKLINIDSVRKQFLENVEYCEKYEVTDTFYFLKHNFYAFVNYDYTSTFYKLLFCYEDNFMNLTDPDRYKYPVEEFYRKRDIRWLFLFYLERYFFTMNNSIKIDKFCKITLVKISNNKEIEMYGGRSGEYVLMLYQKLIKAVVKKKFKKEVIQEHKLSPLEFIGYKFVVVKTKSSVG